MRVRVVKDKSFAELYKVFASKLNDFVVQHRYYSSLLLLILDATMQVLWFKTNLIANILVIVVSIVPLIVIINHAKRPDLKAIAISVLTIIVGLCIVSMLLGTHHSGNQALIVSHFKQNIWRTFGFTVILAPLYEESIFRIAMINFATPKKLVLSSMLSGLLFIGVHLYNSSPIIFFQYAVISSVLAIVYVKTKNVSNSLATHILYNLLCFIMLFR